MGYNKFTFAQKGDAMSPEGWRITEISPDGTKRIGFSGNVDLFPAYNLKFAQSFAKALNETLISRGITDRSWVPESLGDVPFVLKPSAPDQE